MQAETITSYDSQGQVYQTQVYSVVPTTGAVSSTALTTENYYDPNGNLIATSTPGGLWTKSTYDGAGWQVMQYQTDGGSGTSYADASTVSGDIVLSQTQYLYNGDGEVTETITSDRFNTDHDSATGALGTPTSGVEARVYYSGNYYDLADRLIATVDVGTNGGTAWTMPSSPPSRSSTTLVTSYSYAADAVQVVKLTGSPTGGTFTLSFGGDTTSNIAYNASAATVQSDLAALASIGSGHVVVATPAMDGGRESWVEIFSGQEVFVAPPVTPSPASPFPLLFDLNNPPQGSNPPNGSKIPPQHFPSPPCSGNETRKNAMDCCSSTFFEDWYKACLEFLKEKQFLIPFNQVRSEQKTRVW